MNSHRKQLGISLLEIVIALTASAAATGVAVALYVQSNADAASAEARQKMQVLYMEIDRAYPSGIYNDASVADLEATLAPGHLLRQGPRFGIGPASLVTIRPGPMSNGLASTALVDVTFDTTRACVGILESTYTLPFDASVDGNVIVRNGRRISPEAIADACDGRSGEVQIVVRASETP